MMRIRRNAAAATRLPARIGRTHCGVVLSECVCLVFWLGGAFGVAAEARGSDATQTRAAVSTPPATTVGMRGRLNQLVLPGTQLVVRPVTDRQTPVVVRIVDSFPHGTAYRYDIEYYALEPGTYDLRDYLERQDGSGLDDVAPIPIEVLSTLPPGQVEPNALASQTLPRTGGYQFWLIAGAVTWCLGLVAILLVGRRRHVRQMQVAAEESRSFEERLEAAVQEAREGQLDESRRAELERMVLAYWRRRLSLEQVDAAAAMAAMRQHDEARAALEQLERWLHSPEGAVPSDFRQLMAPAAPPAEERA